MAMEDLMRVLTYFIYFFIYTIPYGIYLMYKYYIKLFILNYLRAKGLLIFFLQGKSLMKLVLKSKCKH